MHISITLHHMHGRIHESINNIYYNNRYYYNRYLLLLTLPLPFLLTIVGYANKKWVHTFLKSPTEIRIWFVISVFLRKHTCRKINFLSLLFFFCMTRADIRTQKEHKNETSCKKIIIHMFALFAYSRLHTLINAFVHIRSLVCSSAYTVTHKCGRSVLSIDNLDDEFLL